MTYVVTPINNGNQIIPNLAYETKVYIYMGTNVFQTQRKTPVANELEVETVMLDDSGNSSFISGFKPQR